MPDQLPPPSNQFAGNDQFSQIQQQPNLAQIPQQQQQQGFPGAFPDPRKPLSPDQQVSNFPQQGQPNPNQQQVFQGGPSDQQQFGNADPRGQVPQLPDQFASQQNFQGQPQPDQQTNFQGQQAQQQQQQVDQFGSPIQQNVGPNVQQGPAEAQQQFPDQFPHRQNSQELFLPQIPPPVDQFPEQQNRQPEFNQPNQFPQDQQGSNAQNFPQAPSDQNQFQQQPQINQQQQFEQQNQPQQQPQEARQPPQFQAQLNGGPERGIGQERVDFADPRFRQGPADFSDPRFSQTNFNQQQFNPRNQPSPDQQFPENFRPQNQQFPEQQANIANNRQQVPNQQFGENFAPQQQQFENFGSPLQNQFQNAPAQFAPNQRQQNFDFRQNQNTNIGQQGFQQQFENTQEQPQFFNGGDRPQQQQQFGFQQFQQQNQEQLRRPFDGSQGRNFRAPFIRRRDSPLKEKARKTENLTEPILAANGKYA